MNSCVPCTSACFRFFFSSSQVLNTLCHAGWQVFLFCANDKGASWAYATPGFGASLAPAHLKLLRQMANPDVDDASKVGTFITML